MIGIAAVSLVVGGIVIMNIMLVSVTERTGRLGFAKLLAPVARMCCCNSWWNPPPCHWLEERWAFKWEWV